MSFLGSIGSLMGGSGLENVLENIFASNVIQHILSGKAFARAVRGHMLTHSALLQLMFEDLISEKRVLASDLEKLEMFKPGDLLNDYRDEGNRN